MPANATDRDSLPGSAQEIKKTNTSVIEVASAPASAPASPSNPRVDTPEPTAYPPWSEGDFTRLRRYLRSRHGPIALASIAEHMGRVSHDVACAIVTFRQSAQAVSDESGRSMPDWMLRPIANQAPGGTNHVIMGNPVHVATFVSTVEWRPRAAGEGAMEMDTGACRRWTFRQNETFQE